MIDTTNRLAENQRVPVSKYEFDILRMFAAAFHFLQNTDPLEKRAKMIPGTWRDLRLMKTLSEKVYYNLMQTVPAKKLQHTKVELERTVFSTKVLNPAASTTQKEYCYAPCVEIERLVGRIVNYECMFCEKCEKDARRCKVRRDIEAVYPWDIPEIEGKNCPWQEVDVQVEKITV